MLSGSVLPSTKFDVDIGMIRDDLLEDMLEHFHFFFWIFPNFVFPILDSIWDFQRCVCVDKIENGRTVQTVMQTNECLLNVF